MRGQTNPAVLILAAVFSFTPVGVHAALIDDFGLGDGPTLVTESLLVAYDVTTTTLSMRGFEAFIDLDDGMGLQSVDGSGINMVLSVDGSGIHSDGSFTVYGMMPSMGFGSGILLSGEISDFGWPEAEGGLPSDDILQFAIDITGGDAASLFGDQLAFLLTGADFPGEWTDDWANSGNATGIAAQPVPIPAALWMMASASLGLGLTRRRKV